MTLIDATKSKTPIVPRSYQIELFSHCISSNTILCAPTGSGKTLTAIMVARHVIEEIIRKDANEKENESQGTLYETPFKRRLITGIGKPVVNLMPKVVTPLETFAPISPAPLNVRIIFVVPKLPIAQQQCHAFNKFISNLVMPDSSLVGSLTFDQSHKTDSTVLHHLEKLKFETIAGGQALKWDRVLPESINIICTTAQSFLNALDKRKISMHQISLIILDEVHNAVKDAPMRRIMIDHYWHSKEHGSYVLPRILGLSASPVSGHSLGEVVKKLLRIANDLDCSVRTCSSDISRNELAQIVSNPDPELVQVDFDELSQKVYTLLTRVAKAFHARVAHSVQLGKNEEARYFAYCLQRVHNTMKSLENISCFDALEEIHHRFKSVTGNVVERKIYESCGLSCTEVERMQQDAPRYSCKWDGLVRELELYRHNSLDAPKAIIFVEGREEASALTSFLTNHQFQCDFMIGGSTENTETLRRFRESQFNILISTSVAEEGLDVVSCNTVIRLCSPNNCIQLMQSRGRARSKQNVRFICIHSLPRQGKNVERALKQERLMLRAVEIMQRLECEHGIDPYLNGTHQNNMSLRHIFRALYLLAPRADEDVKNGLMQDWDSNYLHSLLYTTSRKLFDEEPKIGAEEHIENGNKTFVGYVRFNTTPLLQVMSPEKKTNKKLARLDAVRLCVRDLLHKDLLVFPASETKLETICPPLEKKRLKGGVSTDESAYIKASEELTEKNAIGILEYYCATRLNGIKPIFHKYSPHGVGFVANLEISGVGKMQGEQRTTWKEAKKSAAYKFMRFQLQVAVSGLRVPRTMM